MNKWQTAVLVFCCVSSGFCTVLMLRGGGVAVAAVPRVVTVTNYLGSVSGEVGRGPAGGSAEWGRISYVCAGSEVWAYVDGRMYKPGFKTDKGVVVSVDKYAVRLVGEDGRDHWIFHSESGNVGAGAVPGSVAVAVADKKAGGKK